MMDLLAGARVIEWGSRVAAPLCARLLADLGADVIKVEPPGGDPGRVLPPLIGANESAAFQHLNLGKRGVCLDMSQTSDRERFHRLLDNAHLLIEDQRLSDLRSWRLDPTSLSRRHPHLNVISLTAFGHRGLYRDHAASDLVVWALSGQATANPRNVPRPEMAPLRMPGYCAEMAAAHFAAVAGTSALMLAATGAPPVRLDLATLDAVIAIIHNRIARYQVEGGRTPRVGPGIPPRVAPTGVFPCKDGYVALVVNLDTQWRGLVRAMGDPDWAATDLFSTSVQRAQHIPEIADLLRSWLESHTKMEVFEACQAHGVPACPVLTMREIAENPQFAHRQAWTFVEDSSIGRVPVLRSPFRVAPQNDWSPQRLAPKIGEHNNAILASLRPSGRGKREGIRRLPLEGTRLVELGSAIASPFCTTLCAALGAEVIKVESVARPDIMRVVTRPDPAPNPLDGGLAFNSLDRGKVGITLNLSTPKGRGLLLELVATADVVVENFAVGTMEHFGIGYEALRRVCPDLVLLSLTGFGATGPYRDCVAYGMVCEGIAGMLGLHGYAEAAPIETPLPYNDYIAAAYGAHLVVSALLHRVRTGEGLHLEFAESDLTLHLMYEALLDWLANGREAQRQGNRDAAYPLHGIFRCQGDDAWVGISAGTDEDWPSLCAALGREDWLRTPGLQAKVGRMARRDELELVFRAWAAERTPQQAATTLQAHGIPAAPAYHIDEMLNDPHVRERGLILKDAHRYTKGRHIAALPFDFGATLRPAPCWAEHNDDLFGGLLGLRHNEVERLTRDGVLA